MRRSTTLPAAALACLLCVPALAETSQPDAISANTLSLLAQADTGNVLSLDAADMPAVGASVRSSFFERDTATGNTALVLIEGNDNNSWPAPSTLPSWTSSLLPGTVLQTGEGNVAALGIVGDDNLFAVSQDGLFNTVGGVQSGTANAAFVMQQGQANHAVFHQSGHGNLVAIRQISR